MNAEVLLGIIIPFVGTSLGASFVFFMKRQVGESVSKAFSGFAGGVMTAAAIWSLLIPSIDKSSHLGFWAFVPSVTGLWLGVVILIAFEKITDKITAMSHLGNSTSFFAVTLHNIPEGMAVGLVCAACMMNPLQVPFSSVMALCAGVAIQNIPEGAIVSIPFYAEGKGKVKSFFLGVFSGAVEPAGAVITLVAATLISPLLPLLLSMAAGAMIYVTADKLIYEMKGDSESKKGIISFTLGFTLMMALDVALG